MFGNHNPLLIEGPNSHASYNKGLKKQAVKNIYEFFFLKEFIYELEGSECNKPESAKVFVPLSLDGTWCLEFNPF